MNRLAQPNSITEARDTAYTRNSRASWIGSKLIQSLGIEPTRMDSVHQAMMLRLLREGDPALAEPCNECDMLAAHIVALARLAEQVAATDGPNAAIFAIMRESGNSIDPLLAQSFVRLASSPIFWMALGPAGTRERAENG